MMKKSHKLILAGALGVAAIGGGILTGGVSAYLGNPNQTGPNYSAERHEAMLKAFENNDYEAWQKLHQGRGRMGEVVNKDNFEKFVEMRKLMLDGKTDEADKIRQELGLGQGKGNSVRGMMSGQNKRGNFVDSNRDGKCDRL